MTGKDRPMTWAYQIALFLKLMAAILAVAALREVALHHLEKKGKRNGETV